MANKCAHCGKILPSDNTRYCNNCEKVVPASRQIKQSLPEEPPAWIKQLESSLTNTNPTGKCLDRIADVSTTYMKPVHASNMTREDTRTQPASDNPELTSQQEVPLPLHNEVLRDKSPVDVPGSEKAQPAKPLNDIPLRELRIKVWEQEETSDLSVPEDARGTIEDKDDMVKDLPTTPLSVVVTPAISKQPVTKSNHTVESFNDEEIVEDLPTGPLVASPPEIPSIRRTSSPPATGNGRVEHPDEIEKILTRPLVAQQGGQRMSPTVRNPGEQQRQALRTPVEPVQRPVLQRPVTPVPFSRPYKPPAQAFRLTPPVSMPVPLVARPKWNSRKRLGLVLILLFTLLVGGVTAWVIVFKPFSVPEVTNTTQTFQNTDLGVSLHYPQSWKTEVDKQNGAVYFYDDNHTDQVNITAIAVNGQSVDQFVSKDVSSLSMTGQKTLASLSFAGASWQQVQGTVQQSGVSYAAMLLVTIHGGRYYTILQIAPSSTYIYEDHLVFSKMRSSFQFM